jgi:excisionase family DNA binding protein
LVVNGPSEAKGGFIERLYSVEEAAEVLRVSHWTIWAWLKTGKLRGTKIGGDRRVIKETELQRLIVDDPLRDERQRT